MTVVTDPTNNNGFAWIAAKHSRSATVAHINGKKPVLSVLIPCDG